MTKRRLGWLGPAIVILGLIVGGLGVWFMASSKPTPGVVIDEIAIPGDSSGGKVVIRAETGGERSFVELHEGGKLVWRALVPTYAGRTGQPAIAVNAKAVSVRVVRDGKAEIFAVARRDASKLGGIHLASGKGPIDLDAKGPFTVHDQARSYEIVTGKDWVQLIGVDLTIGKILWSSDLLDQPVTAAGLDTDGHVWIEQGGEKRYYDVFTGKENRSPDKRGMPPTEGVPSGSPTPASPSSSPANSAEDLR